MNTDNHSAVGLLEGNIETFEVVYTDGNSIMEVFVVGEEQVADLIFGVCATIHWNCAMGAAERKSVQEGAESLAGVGAVDFDTPGVSGEGLVEAVTDGAAVDLELREVCWKGGLDLVSEFKFRGVIGISVIKPGHRDNFVAADEVGFHPDLVLGKVVENVGSELEAVEGHGGLESNKDFDGGIAECGFGNILFEIVGRVRNRSASGDWVEFGGGVTGEEG